MQIIRHYKFCSEVARNSVVALGNFDGVHLGHKAVIGKACKIAQENSLPSAVMTFEPHPVSVLRPDIPPLRITPFRTKAVLIRELGVDVLFAIRFDRDFAQITAEDFIEKILLENLGVRHVVIGYDFIFGHNREGNAGLLRKMSEKHGFGLTQVNEQGSGDLSYSSTRIRRCLQNGDIAQACNMLGHDYVIEGVVVRGDARGREIGFPTANIRLGGYMRPAFGVYAADVSIQKSEARNQKPEYITLSAVVNIGRKPTFGGEEDLLEAHIFDFNRDIYGRRICVTLRKFLRPEQKFNNADELKEQINNDCKQAREYFTER